MNNDQKLKVRHIRGARTENLILVVTGTRVLLGVFTQRS